MVRSAVTNSCGAAGSYSAPGPGARAPFPPRAMRKEQHIMASSEPAKPSLPDVPDLLDVLVPAGPPVLAISDLHLPPRRTDDSARTCGVLAARLAASRAPSPWCWR